MSRSLSKSRIQRGLQCKKALWYDLYQKELASSITAAQEQVFATGHEVGEAAQKCYPGGVLVDAAYNETDKAIQQTQQALKDASSIYEATFVHNGVLVKVDILNRTDSGWQVIEVKSTTKVKPEHKMDLAIQAWVLADQDLEVEGYYLMHLNNKCRFPRLENLFQLECLSEAIEKKQKKVAKSVSELKKVVDLPSAPNIPIGTHCRKPYDCPYIDHCWSHVPEQSVFELPGVNQTKKFQYFDSGQQQIKNLNSDDFKSEKARRAIECVQSNKRIVQVDEISEAMKSWRYPLYFLDFETIGYAIPRYPKTTVYQAVPYQFSCHVLRNPDSELEHFEYLHVDSTDPREPLAHMLTDNFEGEGSVVAYNMGFEKNVLLKLVEQVPRKFGPALKDIAARLVDPLPILRSSVYDPAFKGSFSIKYTAPALLGESASYQGMEVAGGQDAGAVYRQLIDGAFDSDPALRDAQIQALLAYCRQDTLVMVELVRWLYQVSESS